MASWQLGKIFAVDEETEVNNVSGSDAESEDSDDEARDRAAAFDKHKRNSDRGTAPVTGSSRSIRRYDEYGSFITRSERARKEKAEELPKSAVKDEKAGIVKGKGKVTFRGGFIGFGSKGLSDIKEIPELSDEDKERLFMTRKNWEAIDTDIDVTEMRWKNHMEGKIKFDEDNNSIRGIEDMIFHINKGKVIREHRKIVLEEVNRQKIAKEYPDWKKLSEVSCKFTDSQNEKAQQLAKEDEKEKNRVWLEVTQTKQAADPACKTPDKKKKKGGLFGLFKKK